MDCLMFKKLRFLLRNLTPLCVGDDVGVCLKRADYRFDRPRRREAA
jgi:hypothetical protein